MFSVGSYFTSCQIRSDSKQHGRRRDCEQRPLINSMDLSLLCERMRIKRKRGKDYVGRVHEGARAYPWSWVALKEPALLIRLELKRKVRRATCTISASFKFRLLTGLVAWFLACLHSNRCPFHSAQLTTEKSLQSVSPWHSAGSIRLLVDYVCRLPACFEFN